jgi:hypothetical protein
MINQRFIRLFPLVCLLMLPVLPGGAGEVVFDFETGDLQGWRVIDGGFGELISGRGRFHHTPEVPHNHAGKWFLSTLESRDGKPVDMFTGIVVSPVFEVSGGKMSLLAGGGKHKRTVIELCGLDGEVLREARGRQAQEMHPVIWDAADLAGRKVYLRVTDLETGGWGHITFDNFHARGRIDEEATARLFARIEEEVAAGKLRRAMAELRADAIRAALRDLRTRYPEAFPEGNVFETRLALFEKKRARIAAASLPVEAAVKEIRALASGFDKLRRNLLRAHPLLREYPILYVSRRQYRPDHHNTATLFQKGEINEGSFEGGGALKCIGFGSGGAIRTLLEAPEGIIRDPEVSFDGRRILFSMRRNRGDAYHIYEINADGTRLRQLTGAEGVSDIDPLYLPDGGIAFSSTREPKYCMCNRHIMANLFRMTGDGANIHQIGKSTLFEGHGALLPDGRILYDRWEYVDRNFGDAQGLWTVYPDGSGHALYWGNNTNSPGGVLDARPVPGRDAVICNFSSCHDRPWGAIALVDRRRGLEGKDPVIRTWPEDASELIGTGNYDTFIQVKPKYEDPYPLDEAFFLVSRMTGRGEEMGIYLIDVFGNEILLHGEAPGCYDPMPIMPRPVPPAIPDRREYAAEGSGVFYVSDVYEGTHMQGVKRGDVKFLRIVESPEKRSFNPEERWGGQGQQNPAMGWHDFNNKRILGTVPVEADGSAHFRVPADTFLYFQLLDEKGMMIQSMRSGTIIQPGETQGCIGCHEPRLGSPRIPDTAMPLALRREADTLKGWHGPPRLFSYRREVQPVFDRHCVSCHDYGGRSGDKLLLCGDQTLTFNTSYNELWRKKKIAAIGAGPHAIQPARSWGSHASPIIEKLLSGHHLDDLSLEEFNRIVTWIDINAPYYPRYETAYPLNLAGRSPLNHRQLGRLRDITGTDFFALASHHANRGPQISFQRPGKSPCLAELDTGSAKWKEAVALIREGAAQLEKRARADMDGFSLDGMDAEREKRYMLRAAAEARNREAIRAGKRITEIP